MKTSQNIVTAKAVTQLNFHTDPKVDVTENFVCFNGCSWHSIHHQQTLTKQTQINDTVTYTIQIQSKISKVNKSNSGTCTNIHSITNNQSTSFTVSVPQCKYKIRYTLTAVNSGQSTQCNEINNIVYEHLLQNIHSYKHMQRALLITRKYNNKNNTSNINPAIYADTTAVAQPNVRSATKPSPRKSMSIDSVVIIHLKINSYSNQNKYVLLWGIGVLVDTCSTIGKRKCLFVSRRFLFFSDAKSFNHRS